MPTQRRRGNHFVKAAPLRSWLQPFRLRAPKIAEAEVRKLFLSYQRRIFESRPSAARGDRHDIAADVRRAVHRWGRFRNINAAKSPGIVTASRASTRLRDRNASNASRPLTFQRPASRETASRFRSPHSMAVDQVRTPTAQEPVCAVWHMAIRSEQDCVTVPLAAPLRLPRTEPVARRLTNSATGVSGCVGDVAPPRDRSQRAGRTSVADGRRRSAGSQRSQVGKGHCRSQPRPSLIGACRRETRALRPPSRGELARSFRDYGFPEPR
jgi:hypothetical protein